MGREVSFGIHKVTKAIHHEDWNEYIEQTCSRTDDEGNVEYYDCSYVQYYPAVTTLRVGFGTGPTFVPK